MQKSTLLIGTLLLSFAAGLAYTRPVPQDDDPSPLADAMGTLQGGQRKLRKQLKDTENSAAAVATLQQMQRGAITALGLPPAPPEGMEDGKKPAWRIDFQRQMVQVLDTLLTIELAVTEGRTESAMEAYKALGALKKSGHDTYQ